MPPPYRRRQIFVSGEDPDKGKDLPHAALSNRVAPTNAPPDIGPGIELLPEGEGEGDHGPAGAGVVVGG